MYERLKENKKHEILLAIMGIIPSPISRIRTFREDINRLQGKPSESTTIKARPPEAVAKTRLPKINKTTTPVVVGSAPKVSPAPTSVPQVKIKLDTAPKPVTPAVPKTVSSKIDAELAKDISVVGATKPRSILSQEGRVFDVMETDDYKSEGSIITDRKRERFKLLPAMVTALKEWFSGQQEKFAQFTEKEEAPVATIRPAKTREEILSKAFRQSAIAPKDDYARLASRLQQTAKARPAETRSGTLTIKKSTEIAAPSWTHLEEKSEAIQKENSVIAESTSSVSAAVATSMAESKPAPAATETAPEPKTTYAEAYAEPEVEPEPEPEPEPIALEEPDLTPPPYRAPVATRTNRENAPFSLIRVGAVMLLAILLGVSGTLWFFGGGEVEEVATEKNEMTSLINAEEQIAVPLGRDSISLMRNILGADPRTTTAIAQVYPEMDLAGDTIPAGAAEILSVLDLQAPGTFVRAVTAINFGIYRNREPFIILKLTSFDTALGGMLAWEESMSPDLSPLFGAPVAGTFDPQARTATQIREPYFVDVVVGNYDARLLLDETQKERLIYVFVNRNTVIITANRDALLSLAANIK